MNAQQFDAFLDSMTDEMKKVLKSKAKEYASDKECMHNFIVAAKAQGCTPIQAAYGMYMKHWVAVQDIVHAINRGETVNPLLIIEKFGDSLNYLALMYAMAMEPYDPLLNGSHEGIDTNPEAQNG